ncbi:hypothetical protein [uncultured Alistipes sp.]|jgi:hypothetical protein|uniref:leucine-rich repeat domain-containing protein n=1 Tax=uncultured Alistipes sp. TaxID=538949 RepID=UPI0025DA966D|nr:hypothetical protein [uncultured Alistipes sp.]
MKTFHLFILLSLLLNLSCSKDEPGMSDNTIAYFADPVFNAFCLEQFDGNADGVITVGELRDVTELIIRDENMESLAGIEYFVNLETLDCSLEEESENRGLRELDVTRNPKLIKLICDNNRLEKLNVRGLKRLGLLQCTNNKLRELDLRGLNELSGLDCSYNELTKLDFSVCPKMRTVGCSDNRITHLDLRKCGEKLRSVMCSDNPGLSIDLKWDQAVNLFHDEDCVVNIQGDSNLEFSEPSVEKQLAVRYDDNGDGRISRHEALLIVDLFDLDCSDVTSLVDLNNLTRLELCRLQCRNKAGCNLSSLNSIAGNDRFKYVQLVNLPIESVDLSKYPKLVNVHIRECDLRELDLSELRDLKALYCKDNPNLKSVIFKDKKQQESLDDMWLDEHVVIKYKNT